jgi:hypothetical protein
MKKNKNKKKRIVDDLSDSANTENQGDMLSILDGGKADLKGIAKGEGRENRASQSGRAVSKQHRSVLHSHSGQDESEFVHRCDFRTSVLWNESKGNKESI